MLLPIMLGDYAKATYTSAFGPRWGKQHRGVDIGVPVGTILVAALDGTVIYNRTNNGGASVGYGHFLVIHHEKEKLYTLYAHLKSRSPLKEGSKVTAGDFIAHSGNTGNTTGPHLHFEIHENGFLYVSQIKNKDSAVDPIKYYPGLKNYLNKRLTGYAEPNYINLDILGKKLKVEGKFENNTNYLAVKKNNKTKYIPIRDYFAPLGLNLSWNESTKTVVIK